MLSAECQFFMGARIIKSSFVVRLKETSSAFAYFQLSRGVKTSDGINQSHVSCSCEHGEPCFYITVAVKTACS